MAKTVQKGDLVKLFRRKKPGLGLVLKDVKDVTELVADEGIFETLYKNYYNAGDWEQHRHQRDRFINESGLDKELAWAFLNYSRLAAFPRNRAGDITIKKAFVYIRWVKKPSEYEITETREVAGWYPSDWLKKV